MIGVGTFKSTPRMSELVNQVLATNRLSYGPMCSRFEFEVAALHGAKFGLVSNSGTSSLQVAVQAMKELHGWQDGDEVIVPALTFVATVNVLLHNRLTPVLVDVESDFYGIDCEKIRSAITPRTRAIMPVHLFGMPSDMRTIADIAWRHHLKIIEDSCECMFVTHYGRHTGHWGDVGVFSTYIAHLLTTGIGGLAITDNPDYAKKMRSLLNHGRDNVYISIDDDDVIDRLPQVIGKRFRFESVGHSFRMTELEAAIGLAQLENWSAMIHQRQKNAACLTARLSPLEIGGMAQLPSIRPHTEHAFMMYPIVLSGEGKDGLVQHLESHGIETRDMLPLTNQPVYAGMFKESDYPVAQHINNAGFYIGCHQDITTEDIDYIADVFYTYMGVTE